MPAIISYVYLLMNILVLTLAKAVPGLVYPLVRVVRAFRPAFKGERKIASAAEVDDLSGQAMNREDVANAGLTTPARAKDGAGWGPRLKARTTRATPTLGTALESAKRRETPV